MLITNRTAHFSELHAYQHLCVTAISFKKFINHTHTRKAHTIRYKHNLTYHNITYHYPAGRACIRMPCLRSHAKKIGKCTHSTHRSPSQWWPSPESRSWQCVGTARANSAAGMWSPCTWSTLCDCWPAAGRSSSCGRGRPGRRRCELSAGRSLWTHDCPAREQCDEKKNKNNYWNRFSSN